MLYETTIRLADGKLHKLYYDTETEWLWFARSGKPYLSLPQNRIVVRVPERIHSRMLYDGQ